MPWASRFRADAVPCAFRAIRGTEHCPITFGNGVLYCGCRSCRNSDTTCRLACDCMVLRSCSTCCS